MAPNPGPAPDAFLSYTRSDDAYTGGQITSFRQHLELAVRAVTGKPFTIFQDVDGIGLGEHWPDKLDRMLDRTRFFMPFLTPSYFESRPCRAELERFLDAERRAGRNDLILPVYFIEAELLEDGALRSGDPLAELLHERQRHDWRRLLFEPFDGREVRLSLQKLAREIRDAERRHHEGSPTPAAQAPALSGTPSPGKTFRDVDASWCPEMVILPPGSFRMGSPEDEIERERHEDPQHGVVIEKPFALGRCPVTRGEFAEFAEETGHEGGGVHVHGGDLWKLDPDADWRSPGFAQTDRHPVVGVSRDDALAYLAWLSEKTGRRYELPSEAMWEFACRAGSATPFWTGRAITADQANFDGTIPYGGVVAGRWRQRTTDVTAFPANPFGLHDMHGNVWEWCADRWHGSHEGAPGDGSARLAGKSLRYVVRGGSWLNGPELLRSAKRYPIAGDLRYYNVGLRCARLKD